MDSPAGRLQRVPASPTPLALPSPPFAPHRLAANRNVLEALWTNFNQVADGFGLNLAVFQTICSGVDGLRVTAEQCQKLFAAFDSDQVCGSASLEGRPLNAECTGTPFFGKM